jgi:SAM-dependent methyltransferase
MAGNERDLHPLPEEAFGRYDETPDEEFYLLPRFVTHIDDHAIAAVTQLYRELFPAGGEILDLMSSWVSHLPPEVSYRRVIGLGMNEAELRRNERLDSYVVQNLNRTPELPFHDAEFDGCGICVSIDYLTRPVEVLHEVGRALKVGAFQVASDRQDVGQLRRLEHRESPEIPTYRPLAVLASEGDISPARIASATKSPVMSSNSGYVALFSIASRACSMYSSNMSARSIPWSKSPPP